ncbi:hypothetical protein FisN_22Hh013 [Fistulifera solaris]|uniref:Copper transport protein n=1 Tax=Fistulifera solaris TaxID=1519565 RepID=A0A1Z5K2F0_FISSO|nr:hypothetical protein FisN_22Hh013 [Fistulifera solaris]|eukprot:GAX20447.1 hypothetical protein FisN_22Hh013 [Fistulifera solaris]
MDVANDWEMLTAGGSNSTSVPFCQSSMGNMIMYMDGFRFSLRGRQPCLNLLFPEWTLDTSTKFYIAMMGVFFLAVSVEGFSKLRHRVVRAARLHALQGQDAKALWLRSSVTVLHGTQALLGYTLMLVTMTFSIELLLCVVVGLAVGYAIFFQRMGLDSSSDEVDSITDEARHVTSNPCCEFMSEESREVAPTDDRMNRSDALSQPLLDSTA